MSAIVEMISSIVTADLLLPVGIVATRLAASCWEESQAEGKSCARTTKRLIPLSKMSAVTEAKNVHATELMFLKGV
jgi:hypothetical protein